MGCAALAIQLCCCPFLINAQSGQVTLSALVDSAVRHLPLIRQREAEIQVSRADLTATRHSFLPTLRASEQLTAGTDNSMAGSYFSFGLVPSTSGGVRAQNNPAPNGGAIGIVYANYELYNFGLNPAQVKLAQANIDVQQSGLARDKYLLQLRVARQFFLILKSQYRLSADQQNIYRYDSIFTVIRALASAGISAGADSSLAKAELSKARVIYNQTLETLEQQRDELSYLTGIPSASLSLDSASLEPARHPLQEDSVLRLPERFPLLQYFLDQKNRLLANAQVIRKSYLPKISLVAAAWGRGSSIQYNDGEKSVPYGWGFQRFNYLAGIDISYSLFSGLYRKDQLAINRARSEASDYAFQQEAAEVNLASQKADRAIKSTSNSYREIPVQLAAATETYRQKLAQYRAGLISLIDLNNASFVLYRSQIDFTEGLTDLFVARLEKAAATGNLNSFIQSFKQ